MIKTVHESIVREALNAVRDRRDSTFESIFAEQFTYEPYGERAYPLERAQAKLIAEALRNIAFDINVEEINESEVRVSWNAQRNNDQPASGIPSSQPTQNQVQGASIIKFRDQHVVRITAEPDRIGLEKQPGVDLLSSWILAGTSLAGDPVSQNDPFGGGSSKSVKKNP